MVCPGEPSEDDSTSTLSDSLPPWSCEVVGLLFEAPCVRLVLVIVLLRVLAVLCTAENIDEKKLEAGFGDAGPASGFGDTGAGVIFESLLGPIEPALPLLWDIMFRANDASELLRGLGVLVSSGRSGW